MGGRCQPAVRSHVQRPSFTSLLLFPFIHTNITRGISKCVREWDRKQTKKIPFNNLKEKLVDPSVRKKIRSYHFLYRWVNLNGICAWLLLPACMLTAHLCSPAQGVRVSVCRRVSGAKAVMEKMKSVFAEVLVSSQSSAEWEGQGVHTHSHNDWRFGSIQLLL